MMLILLLLGAPIAGADSLNEPLPSGHIDWTRHLLVVESQASSGTGAWRDIRAVEQAARSSLEPALVDLARGVRVYGDVTAGALMDGEDDVAAALEANLLRWQVTEARYYSSGRVELRAELDLRAWLSPALAARAQGTVDPTRDAGSASGVVVDARSLSLSPSVAPRVVDASGAVIYGPPSLSEETAALEAPSVWVADPADPRAFARAGAAPVFLRAAGVEGGTDLVLHEPDATILRRLGQETDLLSEAQVVIVVD